MAVARAYFNTIEGSTDSETMFALALTFGLMDEPLPALERMVALVEEGGHAHDIEFPLQMTLGVSDGERLWAVRYSTEGNGKTRSLWSTVDAATVRALDPNTERLQRLGDEDRVVVSEPLGGLPGMWQE